MTKEDTTFFELAIKSNALLLGDFTLKSGKKSPYFFNIGSFFSEGYVDGLAALYSDLIIKGQFEFDVIFGPAYKGIPLAAAVATCLGMKTARPIPFAFNRKEEKAHGEGGNIVGELKDKKVFIIDDVLTAGTALKQSMEIISNAGGKLTGCMVALDREEIFDQITARENISTEFGIEITSIAKISQLVDFFDLSGRKDEANVIRKYLSNL